MSFFIVCQQELYILFDDFSFSYFSTQKYHSDAQHFKVNLMFDARKRLMDIKIRKNRTMRTVERANAYSGREEHQKDVFAFSLVKFYEIRTQYSKLYNWSNNNNNSREKNEKKTSRNESMMLIQHMEHK